MKVFVTISGINGTTAPFEKSVLSSLDDNIDRLRNAGFEVAFFPELSKRMSVEDIRQYLPGFQATICGGDAWTPEAMDSASEIKIISRIGAGYDTVNVPEATKRGIAVTTTPGTGAPPVAEYALTAILTLSRKLLQNRQNVYDGKWERVIGRSLYNKTLGIIGLGRIGRKLSTLVKGFDMKVAAYDLIIDQEYAGEAGITYLPLAELLSTSDYISIHTPFSPETKGLIGKKELSLLKREAYLVNAARGGIVDEDALYEALKEQRFAGAALDVFDVEPVLSSNPLLQLPNVLPTPHFAGATYEGIDQIFTAAVDNVLDFFSNKKPDGIINPEVLKCC